MIPTIPLRQESSPAFKPFEQPVIADDKVRYVGEPIAVVLADSAAAAEDALEAIVLDIEPLAGSRGQRRRRAATPSCCSRRRAPISRSRFAACAAMPTPPSCAPPTSAASGSASSATARCRWSRAGCSRNGTPRSGRHDRSRRRQGRVCQPAHAGQADGSARKHHPHGGKRCRRRLRRARRILSRGFPDPVRGAAHRPAGQMDRGPPRASARPPIMHAMPIASWRSPASRTAPSWRCADAP